MDIKIRQLLLDAYTAGFHSPLDMAGTYVDEAMEKFLWFQFMEEIARGKVLELDRKEMEVRITADTLYTWDQ